MKFSKIENVQIVRVHVVVSGLVQGIGYRWFVRDTANQLNLEGWVKNLSNGKVELEAQGPEEIIEKYIDHLKHGHEWARIDNMETNWISPEPKKERNPGFQIT